MRPEKQRHCRVKQRVAEARQSTVVLGIAKEWQSSAQKCKGEGLSCKALFGNGIEMNRSAIDLLGTAQQRLCEG